MKRAGDSLLFENTHSATVSGNRNAYYLRHIGEARHVGEGKVFPVFIWICHNWVDTSQSDAHEPIRTSFRETIMTIRGASWNVEQTRPWWTSSCLLLRLELGQHHCCRCPASLCHQVINSHGIGYVRNTGPWLPWRRISTTFAISVLRSDRKC